MPPGPAAPPGVPCARRPGGGRGERWRRGSPVRDKPDRLLRARRDELHIARLFGQRRRLEIARTMASRPKVVLLDEPFVSIDRKLARELQALVASVVDRLGLTVLLVTHDPYDAAVLADRVITLRGRPVRVVDDMALDTPRAARNADHVAAIVSELDMGMRE